MKTLEHLNRQSPKNLNKSLKRKKFCKFTKAEHKYILSIPKFSFVERFKTVDEFYEYWNKKKESSFFGISYFYKCELCGKEKWEYKKVTNS